MDLSYTTTGIFIETPSLDDCQPRLKSASSARKTWLWPPPDVKPLLLLLLLLLFIHFCLVYMNTSLADGVNIFKRFLVGLKKENEQRRLREVRIKQERKWFFFFDFVSLGLEVLFFVFIYSRY